MSAAPAPLRVVVARSEPTARREFEVARDGVHVVLDALAAAARQDPSLYFRFSCRSGYCGTCTVLVDGRPSLACQAPIDRATDAVRVAPLGGFPVVRDLVVDPAPFAERWADSGGRLQPSGRGEPIGEPVYETVAPRPLDPAAREVVEPHLDCISCGACYAACDLSALDRVFLGPAALTRAMVVVGDSRHAARADGLARVAGRGGVEGCHGIGACSLVCPKGLDPARAIRRLRRWRVAGLP